MCDFVYRPYQQNVKTPLSSTLQITLICFYTVLSYYDTICIWFISCLEPNPLILFSFCKTQCNKNQFHVYSDLKNNHLHPYSTQTYLTNLYLYAGRIQTNIVSQSLNSSIQINYTDIMQLGVSNMTQA